MAQLYEIGEPLHHPDLLKCIGYAHKRKIGTVVSTTLSVPKPDSYWKDMVTSGLDRLIVAIDGTTEAVYNRYRTHGNLNLVMDNLIKILHFKKENRGNLSIEWQMIDFPWNQGEQSSARELAAELGCDHFQIIQDTSDLRESAKKSKKPRTTNCIWPYVLLLVNVYDDVLPCFKPAYSARILGNLQNSNFTEIWNGQKAQEIRNKELIQLLKGCRICIE
jgi:MoaA/NifB/PqqE/SkfB family radical SAM enzyme